MVHCVGDRIAGGKAVVGTQCTFPNTGKRVRGGWKCGNQRLRGKG